MIRRGMVLVLALLLFAGESSAAANAQAVRPAVFPFVGQQTETRCLQDVPRAQFHVPGYIYHGSITPPIWRLNSTFESAPVDFQPPATDLIYWFTDAAHKTLILQDLPKSPADRPIKLYFIQHGKTTGHYLVDSVFDAPLSWTNLGRFAINLDAAEPDQNGFALLEPADGTLVTRQTFRGFAHAMRVSYMPNNGFYVGPEEDRVVYGAMFGEGDARERGLAMATLPSKAIIWTTTGNFIYSQSWSVPSWSPDGERFAYVHQDYAITKLDITIVDKNGVETTVTNFDAGKDQFITRLSDPVWSPDSQQLAFWVYDPLYFTGDSPKAHPRTLYVLNLRTGVLRNTCYQVNKVYGVDLWWSPDNTMLAAWLDKQLVLFDLAHDVKASFPLDDGPIIGWLDE